VLQISLLMVPNWTSLESARHMVNASHAKLVTKSLVTVNSSHSRVITRSICHTTQSTRHRV